MKHVRTFEGFRNKKNREDIIKEAVLQVNDIYKVKTMIDIPQSLINSYIKKVKDTTGKNLRTFFGDVDLAEEIVKWVTMNFLDVDKIPGGALMGGQTQAQPQGEVQPQAQTEVQPQAQTEVQPQVEAQPTEGQPTEGQVQVQTEAQPTEGEFEEPQAQATQGEEEEEEEEELPL
jgi:hypothetical protein